MSCNLLLIDPTPLTDAEPVGIHLIVALRRRQSIWLVTHDVHELEAVGEVACPQTKLFFE